MLTYTGGSLTLQGPLAGTLVAAAGARGAGVVLSLTPAPSGDDILVGTEQADALNGLGGNDTISGLGGSDTLTGGSGNDTFKGTGSELNGDTITDFGVGDTIVISDATFGPSLCPLGNTLVYTGGSRRSGRLSPARSRGRPVAASSALGAQRDDQRNRADLIMARRNDTINGLAATICWRGVTAPMSSTGATGNR